MIPIQIIKDCLDILNTKREKLDGEKIPLGVDRVEQRFIGSDTFTYIFFFYEVHFTKMEVHRKQWVLSSIDIAEFSDFSGFKKFIHQ